MFEEKYFLYSFNWPNLIARLPVPLEISGNICIVIACYSVFDVKNFENYLSVLIKLFNTKNSEQNLNYLKNEKSFKVK